jgi:hypothetical protein
MNLLVNDLLETSGLRKDLLTEIQHIVEKMAVGYQILGCINYG